MNTKCEIGWTYTLPLPKPSLPEPVYPHAVRLLLRYASVLARIKSHLGLLPKVKSPEASQLLTTLVFSYFSRYDLPLGNETHHRVLKELKEQSDVANFEDSDLAFEVTLEVIALTAAHLPGYRSHDENHCARILNMEMVNESDLVLDIEAIALPWFCPPSTTPGALCSPPLL